LGITEGREGHLASACSGRRKEEVSDAEVVGNIVGVGEGIHLARGGSVGAVRAALAAGTLD
jgi:hypothetical protein